MASKFTQQVADEILEYMRNQAGLSRAAAMAGVTRQTVWNWRKAGRDAGRGPKYRFDVEVSRIEAQKIATAEQTVSRLMRQRDDARVALNAATFLLERTAAAEYGRKDFLRVEVDAELQRTLEEVQPLMPHDHFQSFMRALAQVKGVELPPDVIDVQALGLTAGETE